MAAAPSLLLLVCVHIHAEAQRCRAWSPQHTRGTSKRNLTSPR